MAVRATLLHNPTAGYEKFTRDYLLKLLEQQGYTATYTSVKSEGYEKSLEQAADIIVVAGGDGTVRKVANLLQDTSRPIGILPLGTANNIATSLGIQGSPEEIIASWNVATTLAFDIGLVESSEGIQQFYESTGFGMLPRLIREHSKDADKKNSREEALEQALEHQKKIMYEYAAHECTIRLDQETISGKFILLEVMNIPFAGPNMNLAPEATPTDGCFDVVLVQESEREKMAEYLHRRLWGEKLTEPLFTTRPARKISVKWHGIHYHIDDDSCERNAPVRLDIQLTDKKLQFLCQ